MALTNRAISVTERHRQIDSTTPSTNKSDYSTNKQNKSESEHTVASSIDEARRVERGNERDKRRTMQAVIANRSSTAASNCYTQYPIDKLRHRQ